MREFQSPSLQNVTGDLNAIISLGSVAERRLRNMNLSIAELEKRCSFLGRVGDDVEKVEMSFHSVDRKEGSIILSKIDGSTFSFNIPSEHNTLGKEMKNMLHRVPFQTFRCVVCLTHATNPQEGIIVKLLP